MLIIGHQLALSFFRTNALYAFSQLDPGLLGLDLYLVIQIVGLNPVACALLAVGTVLAPFVTLLESSLGGLPFNDCDTRLGDGLLPLDRSQLL